MIKIRRSLFYFGLILGLAIFFWQFVRGVSSIFQNNFSPVVPEALGFVLVAAIVNFGIQIFNWSLMLSGLGEKTRWLNLARGYPLSFLPRYIPGTIWGYFSRSEWMKRELGVPYRLSGAASIIEISGAISSSFFLVGIIGSFNLHLENSLWFIGAISIPIIIWLAIKRMGKIDQFFIFRKSVPNPIMRFPLKTWITCNLIFFIQWFISGLMLWLIFYSFKGAAFSTLDFSTTLPTSIFAYALSWTIGFLIPFIPGGIGIREFILSMLISTFFGLTSGESSMIAVCFRVISSLSELAWIGWGVRQSRK
jgi:hypothetical protein